MAKPKKEQPAKAEKPQKVKAEVVVEEVVKVDNRPEISAILTEQFTAIFETLNGTCDGAKKPRQLRWALKALGDAQDAALRHVQHNV